MQSDRKIIFLAAVFGNCALLTLFLFLLEFHCSCEFDFTLKQIYFLAMDLDETCDESQEQRPLRGFRKRWLPESTALDEQSPRPLSEDVGEGLNQESQFDLFGGNYAESLEPEPSLLDWDLVE